jgi:transcriptional regulator with XRE-family HTH domain
VALALAEVVVASRRTEEGVRMGEEIESLRKEAGFTQKEVADRLGLALQTYLGYRRGYMRVSPNNLRKWAQALNHPVAEVASRLEVDLLTEAAASGLRQELAALLPDADAAELDDLTRRLATLPPSDRRQVIDGWADHLYGRLTRLGRA